MGSTLLTFIAFCVLVPYVVGPFVIWATFRQRAHSTYRALGPHELPPNVEKFFTTLAPDLAREGFVVTAYLSVTASVAGVSAYVAVWAHPARGQRANVIMVVPMVGRPTTILEFETISAADRVAVTTTNLRSNAGIYNAVPSRQNAQLPWVGRPAELYQVHLNRERRLITAGATRYLPDPADIVQLSETGTAVVLREQARAGLFRETSRPGEFRPTFVGAWLFVYRLLPPLKQIRLWRARRRGRADHADALAAPAPRPENVTITNIHPFAPDLRMHPLQYA